MPGRSPGPVKLTKYINASDARPTYTEEQRRLLARRDELMRNRELLQRRDNLMARRRQGR
jgi:hypothetical protein